MSKSLVEAFNIKRKNADLSEVADYEIFDCFHLSKMKKFFQFHYNSLSYLFRMFQLID